MVKLVFTEDKNEKRICYC